MTPQERAQKARIDASERYRWEATYLTIQGDRMHEIDPDGACALWLDGMKALDCALTVEKGRTNGS